MKVNRFIKKQNQIQMKRNFWNGEDKSKETTGTAEGWGGRSWRVPGMRGQCHCEHSPGRRVRPWPPRHRGQRASPSQAAAVSPESTQPLRVWDRLPPADPTDAGSFPSWDSRDPAQGALRNTGGRGGPENKPDGSTAAGPSDEPEECASKGCRKQRGPWESGNMWGKRSRRENGKTQQTVWTIIKEAGNYEQVMGTGGWAARSAGRQLQERPPATPPRPRSGPVY